MKTVACDAIVCTSTQAGVQQDFEGKFQRLAFIALHFLINCFQPTCIHKFCILARTCHLGYFFDYKWRIGLNAENKATTRIFDIDNTVREVCQLIGLLIHLQDIVASR